MKDIVLTRTLFKAAIAAREKDIASAKLSLSAIKTF